MSERTRGRGTAGESITSLRNKHDFGFLGRRSRFDGGKEEASDGRGRWKCTRDRTGAGAGANAVCKKSTKTALRVAAAINLMNDQASTHAWQGRRARDPTHSRE